VDTYLHHSHRRPKDNGQDHTLTELWAQAKYGFANFWHVPQLNWDQTYRDYIPKVLATHSTVEYYRVLQSFYAQLEDGHTGVYPPNL